MVVTSYGRNKNLDDEINNIADRSPENSRSSFKDLQSQKTVKKTDQKNNLFIEG